MQSQINFNFTSFHYCILKETHFTHQSVSSGSAPLHNILIYLLLISTNFNITKENFLIYKKKVNGLLISSQELLCPSSLTICLCAAIRDMFEGLAPAKYGWKAVNMEAQPACIVLHLLYITPHTHTFAFLPILG